jgi:hypothetical protein
MTPRLPVFLQNFLDNHLIKIEMAMLVLVAIGTLIKSTLPIVLSLNFLAILYFLNQFGGQDQAAFIRIPMRVSSIALAVLLVGIMFRTLQLPGSALQLGVGLMASVISCLALAVLLFVKNVQTVKRPLIRSLAWSVVGVLILYF